MRGRAAPKLALEPDFAPVHAILSSAASANQCKDALVIGRRAIHDQFELASATQLLSWQTTLTDLVFAHLWTQQGDSFTSLALVAVGGYGRAELHPYSDIDICILIPRPWR